MNLFLKIGNQHVLNYPTLKNLTYIYAFGSILSFLLIFQIITGFIMTFYYIPEVNLAFDSVDKITNELSYGYLLRFLHMNISSFLFIFIYLHIGKNLYFGLYNKTNLFTWFIGYIIFILMVVISFLGYVLPWGQMSFWGWTVITNLAATLPYGNRIVELIWGGVSVGDPTLRRFFSLHYILPFLMSGLVMTHLFYLHKKGTTDIWNKWNISHIKPIGLYPYFIIKDIFWTLVIFIIILYMTCYYPYFFANPVNEIKANWLVTPEHILPEWYFSAFYWILKFIPSKILDILLMGLFVIGPLFLPLIIGDKKDNLEFIVKYNDFKKNEEILINSKLIVKIINNFLNTFIIKIRFYIISICYIVFWITACTTVFSNDICSLLLIFFFGWIFIPFEKIIYNVYSIHNFFLNLYPQALLYRLIKGIKWWSSTSEKGFLRHD